MNKIYVVTYDDGIEPVTFIHSSMTKAQARWDDLVNKNRFENIYIFDEIKDYFSAEFDNVFEHGERLAGTFVIETYNVDE